MSAATVVNIRRESYDVYIGRAGKGHNGYFGNPFTVQKHGKAALEMYETHFTVRIAHDPEFRRRVFELAGKRLGCFCAPPGGLTAEDKPYRCHGQIIAAWVDAHEVRP